MAAAGRLAREFSSATGAVARTRSAIASRSARFEPVAENRPGPIEPIREQQRRAGVFALRVIDTTHRDDRGRWHTYRPDGSESC